MNIKILYDNNAKTGFLSGWGFSALINNHTLFDTGESADSLTANMQAFRVVPAQIKRVVLSHEDWDHVGGIAMLSQCNTVKVYVPSSFSKTIKRKITDSNPKADLVEIHDALKVEPDLIVTAQLGILKKEISLVVRSANKIVLIVGCSHPGLEKIMAQISKYGYIYAVIGGFHGFRKLKALADVPIIIPTHCTQKKQEILDMYPGQARFVSAGMEIDIEGTQ